MVFGEKSNMRYAGRTKKYHKASIGSSPVFTGTVSPLIGLVFYYSPLTK
jgi:hypothetical protein